MVEPFSPDGPRELLTDLCSLVRQRVPAEEAVAAAHRARDEAAHAAYEDARQRLAAAHAAEKAAAESEYAVARRQASEASEARYAAVQQEYQAARDAVLQRFESEKAAAEESLHTAHWETTALAEAAKGGSGVQTKEVQAQLEGRWQELHTIHERAVALLERWGQWRDFAEPQPAGSLLERHPARRFAHALDLARTQYRQLAEQIAPRFFQGIRPIGIFLVLWAAAVYPAGARLGWDDWRWVLASGGAALAVFVVFFFGWLYVRTRRRCAEAYLALRRTLLEAGLDNPATLETAKSDCQRLYAAIDSRYRGEITRADDAFTAAMSDILPRRGRDLAALEAKYTPRLTEVAGGREKLLQQLDEEYPRRLREIEERRVAESARIDREHAGAIEESRAIYEREWTEFSDRWLRGVERFAAAVAAIQGTCARLLPDWHSSDWDRWTPPLEIPAAFRFGRMEVRLDRLPGGVPGDPRLRPPRSEFVLPAFLQVPEHTLFMLKAADEGRQHAISALQAIMLRLLTATPPGKVRFTIFDPVGLGENFSAFMHLADYEEQLVASRIWTDGDHIEQRLADLTQHMENVIQVYLRNEFQSIQEYNAAAGEMAEPYRVLVVANFPAGFSETAAARLKSVAASGARCGVFVLMSTDTRLAPPHHFQMADLEADALVLRWQEGQFRWEHPDYGRLAVEIEEPPPPERFTDMVRTVGRAVKDAGRVEVPFTCIVPEDGAWWTADSRGGLDVPLGRAGAMKLQHLDLGKGTSQHVLVSGKTGSGKSTLLHVLVTNLALRYSPDELELYLVDFKKGVEFKAYARYALPHARVIAIESEREFGLSVLQRLDGELRTRGDLFRKLGVQDLKGFRGAEPDARLPRILLVIDEFQELFTEDDRIAQEASLLLDRLVRQGRAFGIHVLLGSQTLGGAYSIARSTLGQMAVRIALQCSEGDAHLILSEENTAARLLTRPGEAIYNDANGRFEGNHPFQVVWLPDSERDDYLQRIGQFARGRRYEARPPIVFEGNVPADPAENRTLVERLSAADWPPAGPAPEVWLGSAVAIKDPTSAAFVRQAGSNLLLVGHREEEALAVFASCLISLAVQLPPGEGRGARGEGRGDGKSPRTASAGSGPGDSEQGTGERGQGTGTGSRFCILDGIRPEAPEAGFWQRLVEAVPHSTTVIDPRGAPQAVAELAAELARRQQEGQDRLPPVYLFVYNIGRFRDLRKEDDYGFGGSDDAKGDSPGRQFATLLREGPAWGIHTIVWSDSFSTLSRLLDRQTLRDFEMRVLFQMNATDSSSLMDAPDASRLGVHRAIFYDEARGQVEKFRPYGLPSAEWLARVSGQLRGRNRGA
jgi:energy-coupling factor transporter ATP-binding protein EcfA2